MATFTMDQKYEVREELDSPTLQSVRALAAPGTFKAFSTKYRHPRYKTMFSSPSYCVSFRLDGKVYSEAEDSLEAPEKSLRDCYLEASGAHAR